MPDLTVSTTIDDFMQATNAAAARDELQLGSGDAVTFQRLTVDSGEITSSQPTLFTQTTNNEDEAFDLIRFEVTDLDSDEAYFIRAYSEGDKRLTINTSGSIYTTSNISCNGLSLLNNTQISLGEFSFLEFYDLRLQSATGRQLEMYAGLNPVRFVSYNTKMDNSNYEAFIIDWTAEANVCHIGTAAAGTGTLRAMQLVASSIASNADVVLDTSKAYKFSGRGGLSSTADGVFQLRNAADSAFGDFKAKAITIPTAGNGGTLYLDGATSIARMYCDTVGVTIFGGPAYGDPYNQAPFGVRAQNSIILFTSSILTPLCMGVSSSTGIGWGVSTASLNAKIFYEGVTGEIGQRLGTSANIWSVYNTHTSSTNYERFAIDWKTTANTCILATQKGSGGGARRGLQIGYDTDQPLGFHGATPVVQQVLATGASATVDDVITFLQTIGLCKQS